MTRPRWLSPVLVYLVLAVGAVPVLIPFPFLPARRQRCASR